MKGTGSGCSHARRLAGAHGSAELESRLPNTLLATDGTFLPLFFVFTWPDGSYLNQPRSESDVSPSAALRSPSCASSDKRGTKPSPNAVPSVGTEWN